ncbi:MAG: Panacea domain-containing protein [Solirubrobacteraceae bacterium]
MSTVANDPSSKFKELVVYIARRLPPEAALGRVKLAKLLMNCDFEAYAYLGASITGATYEKWEHGHFPRELVLAEKDLEAAGRISQETISYYNRQLRYTTAQDDPDMASFTDEEMEIIEGVLSRYGHESATVLRALAHDEPGWRLAEDKEAIPYDTVFLSKSGPTLEDVRRGEVLALAHGWE